MGKTSRPVFVQSIDVKGDHVYNHASCLVILVQSIDVKGDHVYNRASCLVIP